MHLDAKLICTLFLAVLITSCSYNPFVSDNHLTGSPVGTAVGAGVGAGSVALLGGPKSLMVLAGLGGGMFGYYVTSLRHDAGGIISAHGQVYRVGDLVGIDVPSDQLFEPNTADFLPQSSAILDSVAVVLQRFPNNNIMISGNTSGFGAPRWEQRLSEKRAQKVSAYLWRAGINEFKTPTNNMRKLNYVGYGDYFPIASDDVNKRIRQNSRIQITSYPSAYDLQLDQRHLAIRNMGATRDEM